MILVSAGLTTLFIVITYFPRPSDCFKCPFPCVCREEHARIPVGHEVSCNAKELRHVPVLPDSTVSLDFSGNKLTKIPANVFSRLTRLKALWLDNNRISLIEPFAFRGMHDLRFLSVRNNKALENLTKFAFSGIRRVQNFLLTDNNDNARKSAEILSIVRYVFEENVQLRERLEQLEKKLSEAKVQETMKQLQAEVSQIQVTRQDFQKVRDEMQQLQVQASAVAAPAVVPERPKPQERTKKSFAETVEKSKKIQVVLNPPKASISWIEKNAFYSVSNIDMFALYGNPLTELRFGVFNNFNHIKHFRLPLGIKSITPGAFAGLSFVDDLTLEGLNLTVLKPETFYNLTDIAHLRIHDSHLAIIAARAFSGMQRIEILTFGRCTFPEIHGRVFEVNEKLLQLNFDRNHFFKIQLNFPESLQSTASRVHFDSNDADCCAVDPNYIKKWRKMVPKSSIMNEFLHGISCLTPKPVFEENLFSVDLTLLHMSCSGVLDREIKDELSRRERQKPALSELYKTKSDSSVTSAFHATVFFLVTARIFLV